MLCPGDMQVFQRAMVISLRCFCSTRQAHTAPVRRAFSSRATTISRSSTS